MTDIKFDIAIGNSRRATSWKNRTMTWAEFLSRIRNTHRTAETLKEYRAMDKMKQDEVKDVGGFVGGYLLNGKRNRNSILHRQLLALDIDFGAPEVWEDIQMALDCACAIYSTHKHTPEKPRVRLIIPMDREVTPEEYLAIGHRIAGDVGIEYFDDTTYEPHRLMYWPSTSKDAEYIFECQDSVPLCVDKVLATYRDWRDVSAWPTSSRVSDHVRREIKKQGDPLEKNGLVGAFCRVHDIESAIATYLSDVYTPCDVEDRYTFTEGSTAAGVVVYEDKFAYSHHGTDPIHGKLCNAFDLVRLHMFGLRDENCKDNTNATKLPSYEAMCELAAADTKVRKLLAKERREAIRSDFADIEVEDDAEDINSDWESQLDVDKKGALKGTIANYELILKSDPKLKGAFAYNAFANVMEVKSQLPWRVKNDLRQWNDEDDAGLRAYTEKRYETVNRSNLSDALTNVYAANRYHPIRDYLSTLEWDGIRRLDTLFVDYMGVDDNKYTRAVTRKSLVAAIKRVMEPGCKYDNVLVLIGRQGVGKSTVLGKLGGGWFSDNFRRVDGKESVEQIQGVWIMEIGELAGLKKAEVETIKNYISTREDRCRLAYARRVDSFPRQCVFFGTSNTDDFLRDATGNRRFWPLDTFKNNPKKDVHTDLDTYEVDQLWAEAIERYKDGEKLYLTGEVEILAQKEQEAHSEVDDRTGVVREYLNMKIPDSWKDWDIAQRRSYINEDPGMREVGSTERESVCVAEIWAELFGQRITDLGRAEANSIRDILRKLNWGTKTGAVRKVKLYGSQRLFERLKH